LSDDGKRRISNLPDVFVESCQAVLWGNWFGRQEGIGKPVPGSKD